MGTKARPVARAMRMAKTDKSQLIRDAFAVISKPESVVLITVDGHGSPYRVRAGKCGGLLECLDSRGKWTAFVSSPDSWLACSDVREPRVWEGTGQARTSDAGERILYVPNDIADDAVVKYRLEEILE